MPGRPDLLDRRIRPGRGPLGPPAHGPGAGLCPLPHALSRPRVGRGVFFFIPARAGGNGRRPASSRHAESAGPDRKERSPPRKAGARKSPLGGVSEGTFQLFGKGFQRAAPFGRRRRSPSRSLQRNQRPAISRSRRIRSSVDGWVEKSEAMETPPNGLTMNMFSVAGLARMGSWRA